MLVSVATHNAVKQELTTALGKVTELEARVEELTAQLGTQENADTDSLTARISELETQISEHAVTVTVLETANTRIEELTAELATATQEVETLRAENAALLQKTPPPTPLAETEEEEKPVLSAYQKAKQLHSLATKK